MQKVTNVHAQINVTQLAENAGLVFAAHMNYSCYVEYTAQGYIGSTEQVKEFIKAAKKQGVKWGKELFYMSAGKRIGWHTEFDDKMVGVLCENVMIYTKKVA